MDFIITVITSGTNLILGMFTILKNPKSDTNRLFTSLTFLLAIWAITNYISLHPPTRESTLFFIRLTMPAGAFMGPVLYLLSRAFPNRNIGLSRKKLFAILAFSSITAILSLSPYMFTSVEISENNVQPVPGPAIILFAISFLGFNTLAFVNLIKKYRSSVGIEKVQMQYLIFGIVVTFSFIAFTTFILVNVFKITMFVVFGPFYTLILVSSIFYTIVKHRFLDIKLIVARSVAYVMILLTLGSVFSFYLLFIGSSLFGIQFSTKQFLFYGAVMLIGTFLFQPLRGRLEIFSDRFFYKGYYDSQDLLRSLSNTMSTTIELEKLTTMILEKALNEMRITRGVFILLKKKDHGTIEYVESKGYDQKLPEFNPHDIQLFVSHKKLTFFDDLEENEIKKTMRNLNISVALPLIVHEEKIGVLFLGEKASGDIYSDQDINVLEILAPELSVAIQNAKEYAEIKRFNITLQEEIGKATKELQIANERLKTLDHLKDEFVSLSSHELRTPMTSIRSYIWMLLENPAVGPLNEKQRLYLDRTYQSTVRLISLVQDMLSVSRIESGRMKVDMKPLSIEQLIKEAFTEVEATAQEKKLTLIFDEHVQVPDVMADKDKIKEVLINLIGNSLKFTPADGKITVTLEQKDGMVITHVADTGKGIKSEDMSKLFQKFGMVEGNYTYLPTGQGTGLGLYISKGLVELHGGKITVESEGENKGTTFSFSLKTT